MRDGNLTVIDSIFTNNQAAPLGPDTGGGAIYVLGSKHGAIDRGQHLHRQLRQQRAAPSAACSRSSTSTTACSRTTWRSATTPTTTTPSMCSVINNGQNEVGSGGNGGAIYSDGNSVNITLCGDAILNNAAGAKAFGGGLFFTSNDMGGTLSITDTTMTGNTGGHWTNVSTGSVTNAGTAVGTNAKSITITSSTIQGVP